MQTVQQLVPYLNEASFILGFSVGLVCSFLVVIIWRQ